MRVFSFDEARFGLINWHRRRYCPKGVRPPWIVERKYRWSWLYAAVEPTTGESLCLYLPRADSVCFEVFSKELGESYADEQILMVLDNGPSHLAAAVEVPHNITLLALPAYSAQLNPVERWFLEFRRALANRSFETIEALHEAITQTIEIYWHTPEKLRHLTGFPWWREAVDQICSQ